MDQQTSKLNALSKEELIALNQTIGALAEKQRFNKFESFFPDSGPYARDKYPKHIEFINKSKEYTIMGLLGANGSGKSTLGSYITYCHLSGKYPKWWKGHRFNMGPISSWVASIETKQLSAIQEILFGKYNEPGTGLIPKEDLLDDKGHLMLTSWPSSGNCYSVAYIRHYDVNGNFDGYSQLGFKTYLQGWEQFQGATLQWIWLDEEPSDAKVYSECLARTRGPKDRQGRLLATFTPLGGWTDMYLSFVPEGRLPENGIAPDNPNKFTMLIDDNQPHLTEEWKTSMLAEWKRTDPLSIEARKKGIATMGQGKIYTVPEDFVVVPHMEIPEYWPRAYGLDFATTAGWTAAIWVAQDPITEIKYVYAEYKRTAVHDSSHVLAIQSKGKWIPGICDPRSGKRDGGELRADYYRSLGLRLENGESNPQAGIAMILNDLEMGQLKFFESCKELIKEYRTYRWDMKISGRPADRQDDHLLDALRYLYSKFDYVAKSFEDEFNDDFDFNDSPIHKGRDSLTGY